MITYDLLQARQETDALRTDNDKLLALVADLQDVIAHQASQLLERSAVMISLDHPVYQAVEVSTFIPQDEW